MTDILEHLYFLLLDLENSMMILNLIVFVNRQWTNGNICNESGFCFTINKSHDAIQVKQIKYFLEFQIK